MSERDERAGLSEDEVEWHACCLKRRLCKDRHFHRRAVERILADRLAAAIARAEAAEARVAAVEALADEWEVALDTSDLWDDYERAKVDHHADLRAALTTPTTDLPDRSEET